MMTSRESADVPTMLVLCTVCEGGGTTPVNICSDCVSPMLVRTYCTCCHQRVDHTLENAQRIYAHFNLTIPHTGMVIRFDGCPSCQNDETEISPPTIFGIKFSTLDTHDSVLN